MTSNISEIRKVLSSLFVEREEVIDALFLGLLSQEHVFLLGPPGTAKSLLVEYFAKCLDASYFRWLLTKFTTPEELLGFYSLPDLEKGVYRRITKGKLPEANIVFLDEIFKASSSILNSLLTIMQERIFFNDSKPQQCPLWILVGASNELPQDASLKALYDRFLIRVPVKYISNQDAFINLWNIDFDNNSNLPTIDKNKIEELIRERKNITIAKELLELLLELKLQLESEGFKLSDRRWIKVKKVLQAKALLEGKSQVEAEDFLPLYMCFWRKEEEIEKVKEIVIEVAIPELGVILELEKSVSELEQEVEQYFKENQDAPPEDKMSFLVNSATKIRDVIKEIDKQPPSTPQKQVLERAKRLQGNIQKTMQEIMGFSL